MVGGGVGGGDRRSIRRRRRGIIRMRRGIKQRRIVNTSIRIIYTIIIILEQNGHNLNKRTEAAFQRAQYFKTHREQTILIQTWENLHGLEHTSCHKPQTVLDFMQSQKIVDNKLSGSDTFQTSQATKCVDSVTNNTQTHIWLKSINKLVLPHPKFFFNCWLIGTYLKNEHKHYSDL